MSSHQSLLKQYIFTYAKGTTVDPVSYALDSILVLHGKVWLYLVQIASNLILENQTQKEQKLFKAQGIIEGVEILLVYLKNQLGFTHNLALRQGFKSLEIIQKILKRKIMRWNAL
ncbi:MAG: hypothetical protein JSU57_05065 [Candidatus Heimdallarchaeota archaeon]|nr:MAG: hypothetical protein JSU57_05065 [Candidatus Heimdallarchaeota archaeon]